MKKKNILQNKININRWNQKNDFNMVLKLPLKRLETEFFDFREFNFAIRK